MKTLITALISVASTCAFGIHRAQEIQGVIDLKNPVTLRSTIAKGVDVSSGPIRVALKEQTGTGFIWQYQEYPAGCISVSEESGIDASETFSPGTPKSLYFEFQKQKEVDGCQVSIALARPWLFSGFAEDGSVIDDSTTVKNFTIPVRTK